MVGNFGMVDIAAGRFVVFGAVAAAIAATRPASRRWPTARQAVSALWLSVLGFTGYYLLLAFAIEASGTAVPSLIIGTIPVWMMLLGRPAGLALRALLPGLALTAAGIGLMVAAAWPQAGAEAAVGAGFGWGLLLALLAMMSWTAFGLLIIASKASSSPQPKPARPSAPCPRRSAPGPAAGPAAPAPRAGPAASSRPGWCR